MTEQGLVRKKHVRGGHRASTTRIIAQAVQILKSEERNPARLRQIKTALREKLGVLEKLDAEIIDLTLTEEALAEEIEQADACKEKIQVMLFELEAALATGHGRISTATSHGRASISPSPMEVDSERQEVKQEVPEVGLHAGVTRKPTSLSSFESARVWESSHTTLGPKVKLPKLTLKRFTGDITAWTTFWETFESSIHQNTSLSNIDKFNYLSSLLESSAADAISGLAITSNNYEEAISVLKQRFGNKQLIISRHMDALLNLETVTSLHNLKGLRTLCDSIESHVRSLGSLGVSSASYGSLLSSILMNKLPHELRVIVSRKVSDEDWEFTEVMETIQKEIEARERAEANPITPVMKKQYKDIPTAASLLSGDTVQGPTCAYCSQPHSSNSCRSVVDVEARKQILFRDGRNGKGATEFSSRADITGFSAPIPGSNATAARASTLSMYVDCRTPVLLQTAKATLHHPDNPSLMLEARIILDSGSQRSYITSKLKDDLSLPVERRETMSIKTFGAAKERLQTCEVVRVVVKFKDGSQRDSKRRFPHLAGIELADTDCNDQGLEISILIGSDLYWTLVTGRVRRGVNGPTALETRFGWVLSGPVHGSPVQVSSTNLISSHVLKQEASCVQHHDLERLDLQLKRFWDLETLGIGEAEPDVYDKFLEGVSFKAGRYEVELPWKEIHPDLPENYQLCQRRLWNLVKRLQQEPSVLKEYDGIIKEQLNKGIIEVVTDNDSSKLAKTPRDSLRFLWIDNIASSLPKIVMLRFTRVVFGITSSPFLLNATLQLHLKKYEMEDPSFVNKFMHSIYVDDVAFGGDSTNEVFELYLKTKSRLAEGGFNLRKFVSNDRGLQEKIERQEGLREMFTQGCTVAQDDNSFAKTSLSYQSDVNLGEQRVLGICWNPVEDKLQFEVKEIAQLAKQFNPTKRTIVSIAAKFYDPLGIISPIIANFKQELCKMKVDWDEPLQGELLEEWNKLVLNLQQVQPITIARCYFNGISEPVISHSLIGFCDASLKLYAAVIYLKIQTGIVYDWCLQKLE
ncbi:hypothetical protein EMCRGX_G000071 [Ephydatia muelleri]